MAARSAYGYDLYFWTAFLDQWRELRTSKNIKEAAVRAGTMSQAEFDQDAEVKLFAALVEIVHEKVPRDPEHKDFRLGKTLGDEFTSWRRVKKHGLPDRYRLFFRFASVPKKVIVFAWLNDDDTLRKAGSKTDVYATFKRMLDSGKPPTEISQLLSASKTGT